MTATPPRPLPCPFCGAKAEVIAYHYLGQNRVGCPSGTHVAYVLHPHKKEAIKLWNQRAT